MHSASAIDDTTVRPSASRKFPKAVPAKDGLVSISMADVLADSALMRELIEWFITVYSAEGEDEWNESWTHEMVHHTLFVSNIDRADVTTVTLLRIDGILAGVDIVSVLPSASVLRLNDLPPHVRSETHVEGVRRNLEWIAGPNAPIAFYQDIGIRKEFRKGPEAFLGLTHRATTLALEQGAEFGCFWTGKRQRLFPLMVGYGVQPVYDFKDVKHLVLMGDHLSHFNRRVHASFDHAKAIIAERVAALR